MQPQDVLGVLFVLVAPCVIIAVSSWATVRTSKAIGITGLAKSASGLLAAKAAKEENAVGKTDRLLMETAAKKMGVSFEQISQWMEEGRITITEPKV